MDWMLMELEQKDLKALSEESGFHVSYGLMHSNI